MKAVGTALGDRVHDTARRAAIFNRVVGGIDLKFLDRLLGGGIAGPGTAPLFGKEGLIVICAVDGYIIQQRALAAETEQTITVRVVHNTRRQQRITGPAIVADRKIVKDLLIDNAGKIRISGVDQRRGAGDLHRLRS